MSWPSNALVIAAASPLITAFEACRPFAYLCPAGVPSIGYGTTRYPDGRRVSLADPPCTATEALAWMGAACMRILAELQQPGLVIATVGIKQGAALLSLAYNVGVGAHDGVKGDLADSTLIADFNAGNLAAAANQFLVWNKARVGGVLTALPGLSRRRAAERELFLAPDA